MTVKHFISKFDALPNPGEEWLGGDNRGMLAHIISELPAGANVLEMGSWLGRSACFMLEVNPDIKLCCMDTWKDTRPPEERGGTGNDTLFDQFIANMYKLGLLGKISCVREDTRNVLKYLKQGSFDAIYIDASHEEEDVYRDFHNAFKLLKVDGHLMGDDWNWNSVSKGVMRAYWEINQDKEVLWPMRTGVTSYNTRRVL